MKSPSPRPAKSSAPRSPEAFRTISEIGDELDVPKHVLRFWEGKFPQIKPMKRGGGRRYYRQEDLDLLRGIRRLLYDEGYTIKGVQKVIRDHGLEFIKGAADPPAKGKRKGRKADLVIEGPADAGEAGSLVAVELSPARAQLLRKALEELRICRELLK